MNEIIAVPAEKQELSVENKLEIIEDGIRKKYLSRMTEMNIVPFTDAQPLESYLIDNVRLYRITEMVYHKLDTVADMAAEVTDTVADKAVELKDTAAEKLDAAADKTAELKDAAFAKVTGLFNNSN